MHWKSDNVEFMIYGKTGEVIKKLFDSLFYIYQIGLEISMKGSDFIFGCVNLLDYECHKTNLNYGGLYMDPPDWIKKTPNPINDDNKYFQYAATVALNHEEIEKNLQGISKIKPFINKHHWKGINYLSGNDYWKKFKKSNPTIALNILNNKKLIYILPTLESSTQIK